MGGAAIPLDLATVMIAGVVLGITVDDTIHLYFGYQERRRRGVSPLFAIARSFQSSGRAVAAISVVLTAQFAMFATSDFIPTANFGMLTVFGLLSGQLAELLLLPALLVLKDVRAKPRSPATLKPDSAQVDMNPWAATVLLRSREATDTDPGNAWTPTRLVSATPAGLASHNILVCQGESCRAHGAGPLWDKLQYESEVLAKRGVGSGCRLVQTSCLGHCEGGRDALPCVRVAPEGQPGQGWNLSELIQGVRPFQPDSRQGLRNEENPSESTNAA
jgi:uncharacterized protein